MSGDIVPDIVPATNVVRIDLRAYEGRVLCFQALRERTGLPGPPPNDATVCIVLAADESAEPIVSEDFYLFWRNVRAKLEVGRWVVGKLTHGHSAWMLDPPTSEEFGAATRAIGSYNAIVRERETHSE